MAEHSISKERLLELGEAERLLKWAQGAVVDYAHGRAKDDVFDELVVMLMRDPSVPPSVNDPLPLTPHEVLTKTEPGWK